MILTKLLESELDMEVDYTVDREDGEIYVELVAVRISFGISKCDVYKSLNYNQRHWIEMRIEEEVDLGSLISKND